MSEQYDEDSDGPEIDDMPCEDEYGEADRWDRITDDWNIQESGV